MIPHSFMLLTFRGTKVDLNPPLLFQPWDCARNLLVAFKPQVSIDCVLRFLPIEIIYEIIFKLIDVNSRAVGGVKDPVTKQGNSS